MKLIKEYNEEKLLQTQFTGSGLVIVILLVLALIGLGERVLYDLSRSIVGTIGSFGYFDNPRVIAVHGFFIIGLLILTAIVNYAARNKEKYAIALIPYFIMSAVLAVQLAIQLGVYFTQHHNDFQFYLVMSLLVIVSSYAIYHMQSNYKKTDGHKTSSLGLFTVTIVIFALFAFLILGFQKTNTSTGNGIYTDTSRGLIQFRKNPNNSSSAVFRIAQYPEVINQYWNPERSSWQTDPDESLKSNANPLWYCTRWYPGTIATRDYQTETLLAQSGSYYSVLTTECVQP